MVYGPDFSMSEIPRIQPVDGDRPDDEREEQKSKRRVLYQGRAWGEKDEELPVQPTATLPEPNPTSSHHFSEKERVVNRKSYLTQFTTIEEKCAKLCFLETKALYDLSLQRNTEILIQTWQIGGILFTQGEETRQRYLIQEYRALSKTSLLVANDFLYSLSLLGQGDSLASLSFSELGEAVGEKNAQMGVDIQLDWERKNRSTSLKEEEQEEFCRGLRKKRGTAGKKHGNESRSNSRSSSTTATSVLEMPINLGVKTITFFDATQAITTESLLEAYQEGTDTFVVNEEKLRVVISYLAHLVRTGKISEEDLDRRLLKLLGYLV
ncbi:MAG: hypothetical protein K940chlam9_01678 [Chlamydiae bacterium]|nr:hypothetical protein [Chlamydiota bacterium]